MIRSILIAISIITSFISFNLGMDWINFGYGLHPVIAFPIATITFLFACLIGYYFELLGECAKAAAKSADAMEKLAHWD